MEYRRLQRTRLVISEISFGCMSLDLRSPKNEFLIHAAIDGGINYFDTADLYDGGENERLLGRAVKTRRNNVIIATKVGNQVRPDGSGWDWNPRKSYILKSVEQSLKRLDTDYIDVYQLHGGTLNDPMDEVVEAFELLREQGKIKHYGISSIRPNVTRWYASNSNIVSNMVQYSLLDRRPEESVLSMLEKQGIGVMVRGALAKGILAGKNTSNYLNYKAKDIDLLIDKMKVFSNEKTLLSHLAIQWTLQSPMVTTLVLGIRTLGQLNEALMYHNANRLNEEELNELGSVLKLNTYENHR